MKKYLVFPTDFSEVSRNALKFIVPYASMMDYNIIAFHAYDGKNTVAKEILNGEKEREVADSVWHYPDFKNIIDEHTSDVKISYVVRSGSLIPSLKKYLSESQKEIELIAMGSHERNFFQEMFVEALTIKVMEGLHMPVLAVPERFDYDRVYDNILFLIDYHTDEIPALVQMIAQAEKLNAHLHIVHFDDAHTDSILPKMEEFQAYLDAHDYKQVSFASIDTSNIVESVKQFCIEHKMYMVYVMNHAKNLYQRIFTQNLAEDLIKNINTPIYAIHTV